MAIPAIDLGPDDGWGTFQVGEAVFTIDLYGVNYAVSAYHKANEHLDEDRYNAGLVEALQRVGVPALSHRYAVIFVNALRAEVEKAVEKDRARSAEITAQFMAQAEAK